LEQPGRQKIPSPFLTSQRLGHVSTRGCDKSARGLSALSSLGVLAHFSSLIRISSSDLLDRIQHQHGLKPFTITLTATLSAVTLGISAMPFLSVVSSISFFSSAESFLCQ
jgi:hypothetical protein